MARRSGGHSVCEECWTLLGRRRGRVWYARSVGKSTGRPASVQFDGPWVLEREERKRDVIGFLHTHPAGPPLPSERDVRTMRAWAGAFGKPLLCVISTPDAVAGFRFDDDESDGLALAEIQRFPRGVIIGVDDDAGQVPS